MDAKKRRGLNILDDIVEEILVKVPVKSLVKFKAVSKQWRGTIESKWFADKQVRSQKSLGGGQARIVRVVTKCFRRNIHRNHLTLENMLLLHPNGLVYSSPYRVIRPSNGLVYSSPYRVIRPPRLPSPRDFKISEPCDGLFCIYTKDREFTLVNPATNSSRILPDPDPDHVPVPEDVSRRHTTLLGIGRENVVSPRYKLLCLLNADKEVVCKVFALDANTWRYVDPPNCRVYSAHPIIHLDGVLYCFGYDILEHNTYIKQYNPKLLAFDLHTETFQSFSVTPDVGSRYVTELSMCVLNHRLCIFRRSPYIYMEGPFFKIWGLDVQKRSLEIMYSIEYSCLPPQLDSMMTIIPVATINNYVILTTHCRTIWGLFHLVTDGCGDAFSYMIRDRVISWLVASPVTLLEISTKLLMIKHDSLRK